MTYLSRKQVELLGKPLQENRVSTRDGLSYLESYDVRAHLNRCFGFGRWSADLLDLVELFEVQGEKVKDGRTSQVVSVGYRATLRLTVCAPDGTVLATYTEAATGDASNFPISKRADASDFAIKTAESQALKRCAINLGDQFGLGLYNKGSLEPLVRWTLVMPPTDALTAALVDAGDVPDVHPENEDSGASAPSQSTWPTPNPECPKCHFTHRTDGVCPPGEPGPGRNKDGSIDQRRLPKAVKAERKQQEAAHEALVAEVTETDPAKIQHRSGISEDEWAQGVAGPGLNLPEPESVTWCKAWMEQLGACVTTEMVDVQLAAARKARSDNRILVPQLGTLVAAASARTRELTDEQSHAATG